MPAETNIRLYQVLKIQIHKFNSKSMTYTGLRPFFTIYLMYNAKVDDHIFKMFKHKGDLTIDRSVKPLLID